jgi:hypothetical protein
MADFDIHLENLSVELIDEVSADRLVNYDVPLYKRLRLIKTLIELGANPNYVDNTYIDYPNTTALEKAFLGEQILHIKLLMHLGAEMTTREIDAMNNTFGVSNIMCLLRICPNLRKFYKGKIWNDQSEESNSSFMNTVDTWINHENYQLKEDPEIISILLDQANIDITPYLQYFNHLLPDACLAALESRFDINPYIRVWMSAKPFIDDVSWKTVQCTIGIYSKPDRMANSLIQMASSSEHSYSNEAAMYDATAKVLFYDTNQKERLQRLPQ